MLRGILRWFGWEVGQDQTGFICATAGLIPAVSATASLVGRVSATVTVRPAVLATADFAEC